MAALSKQADLAGGVAVDAATTAARDNPLLIAVLIIGALAMMGTTVWSVKTTTDAVADRPTRAEMTKAIDAHARFPLHSGAVSRKEFDQLLSRLDRLDDAVQKLSDRIDRLVERTNK